MSYIVGSEGALSFILTGRHGVGVFVVCRALLIVANRAGVIVGMHIKLNRTAWLFGTISGSYRLFLASKMTVTGGKKKLNI